MATTDIAYISPPIVTWAITRANLTHEELAAKLKTVSAKQVAAWEKGEAYPTLPQAEKLAEKLRLPLAILFMPEPPKGDFPIPDLRTIAGTAAAKPSLDFFEVIKDALLRQQWFREFQQQNEVPALPFVGSFDMNSSPNEVARDMARILGINDKLRNECTSWLQFFSTFARRAEEIGVLVMRSGVVRQATNRRLQVSEFRGFAISDSLAPVVFINSRDSRAAQIFTLAHELAHIWLGRSGISDFDPRTPRDTFPNQIERLCNGIAAELLVPQSGFERLWRSDRSIPNNLQIIATYYRVSSIVVLRRAYELNKLTFGSFSTLIEAAYERFSKETRQAEEGGGNFWASFGARNGNRLIEAIVGAVRKDSLQYREAANLLGVKVGTLHRFIESQNG